MDEIIDLLWKRDEQALKIMEKQYGGFCRRIIKALLNNIQDEEEALNDVWLKIWNSIPPAKPKYLKAYLAKAARNTALHYIEREQAKKRSGITVLLDELAECIPAPLFEQEADSIALRDFMNGFIRSLSKEQRNVFIRRYWLCEEVKSIAESFGYSENKVSMILFRIRKRLKKELEKEETK